MPFGCAGESQTDTHARCPKSLLRTLHRLTLTSCRLTLTLTLTLTTDPKETHACSTATNSQSVIASDSLNVSLSDWQSEFGGYTCYVANEEDEEVSVNHSIKCRCTHVDNTVVIIINTLFSSSQLLTVYPEDNSLALVYRDKETLKFVKHVNHKSCCDSASREFYDFSFVYYE